MAASKRPPSNPSAEASARRRRPTPTIDLTATEVPTDSSQGQPAAPVPADVPTTSDPATVSGESATEAAKAGSEQARNVSVTDSPPSDNKDSPVDSAVTAPGPDPSATDAPAQPLAQAPAESPRQTSDPVRPREPVQDQAQEPVRDSVQEPVQAATPPTADRQIPPPPDDPTPPSGSGPSDPGPEPERRSGPAVGAAALLSGWPVAAAASGAAAAVVVLLAAWLFTGWFRGPDPRDVLEPRLAAIESRIAELAKRPQLPGADPKALDQLAQAVTKLEKFAAAPPPSPDPRRAARVDAAERELKALAQANEALRRRADEIGSALREERSRDNVAADALAELKSAVRRDETEQARIAALSQRIASLEKSGREATERLAQRTAAMAAEERRVRLAVAAAALRLAVESGQPFAAELAAVAPLVADAKALAAFEAFADKGVPDSAALGRQLIALVPAMLRVAEPAPREGGFLERLQANAERLVRIRPVHEDAGDDVLAELARVEARAGRGDIDGALTALAKLPPKVRSPAQDWIVRARARADAIEAARKLATGALAALKPAP